MYLCKQNDYSCKQKICGKCWSDCLLPRTEQTALETLNKPKHCSKNQNSCSQKINKTIKQIISYDIINNTMLNKTQLKILAYLLGNHEPVGIRELAREISTTYYLVQRNVQQLKNNQVLTLRKAGKTHLVNFHPQIETFFLCEAEKFKREMFYKKYPDIKVTLKKIIKEANSCFFILLVFGSYVKKPRKDSDLDLLVIIPGQKQIDLMERTISTIAGISTVKIDETVVTEKSFLTMLKKKELNVTQEAKRNHVLIYGDQLYYKLVK